jgi:hypothetical protein
MKNKFQFAMTLAVILAMVFTSLALADNVQNDVTAGGNDTITSGGSTTVNYRIGANNGDGETGCNAKSASPAVVTIIAPAGVTAMPGSLTFTSCGTDQPVVFTSSTVGDHAITVSVSDSGAGTYNTNPAKFTLHVNAAPPPSDLTPPVITPSVDGTLGENGWYVSDVTVSWTVEDGESDIASSSGCDPTTINADTAGTTLTCSATSDGGTASQSVTIKRDASAPSISASADPGPNGNGWNNSDVTVSYSCIDNGPAGVDAAASDLGDDVLSASGTGSGTCVDLAGNSDGASYDALIDTDAPSASASASPAANANGWNNTTVTVSFTGNDGSGSGIDFCDAAVVLSSEGAGQSASGTCTDLAGNVSAPAIKSGINIDKTPPTASASASPAANANGWNNTNVTVSFSGNDALSGIASCDPAVILSAEAAGQSASGTCTDLADNVSALATASGINIDKTAPTVSLVGGPADGASYYFGSVPAAPTCSASDGLSGLDGSCSVSGYSTAVGTHTVVASAKDLAGNQSSASATYTVLAWTLKGFYSPVDMNGVFNVVKGGSTVPLKFEVFAGTTELKDISVVQSFVQTKIACDGSVPVDDIEFTTTGSTSLRYDATAGQFIQNWQTPKLPGQCYRVTMTTDDGSSLVAFFKLK